MEFVVYILYSKNKDRFYIGYTSNVDNRIIRHNQKSKGFTGSVNDWCLVYKEIYSHKESAIKREREIKNWKSRIKIKELIKNSL